MIIQNDAVCINFHANDLILSIARASLKLGIDSGDFTQDANFISHAHADHVGFLEKNVKESKMDDAIDENFPINKNKQDSSQTLKDHAILASTHTVQLLNLRFPSVTKNWNVYGENDSYRVSQANHEIRLLPSGHVLGSRALAVVDSGICTPPGTPSNPCEARFFYTGDFFAQENRLMPPLKPVKCDILACECTFGMPFYEFPPFDVLKREITDWIADSLSEGPVVLYGYSLGKNQELLSLLAPFSQDCTIITDEETCAISNIYKDAGINLPVHDPYKKFSRSKFLERNSRWILVLPLRDRFNERYHKTDDVACHRAVFSGWSLDENWLKKWNVDAGFPLSDHASYSDLISFIDRCSPSDIIFLHGNGTILKKKIHEKVALDLSDNLPRSIRIHASQ